MPFYNVLPSLRLIAFSDYSKLPPSPPVDTVFLLDPLIATGGTACAALSMIVDWGIPSKPHVDARNYDAQHY